MIHKHLSYPSSELFDSLVDLDPFYNLKGIENAYFHFPDCTATVRVIVIITPPVQVVTVPPPWGKFDPPPITMWTQKLKIQGGDRAPPFHPVTPPCHHLDFEKKFTPPLPLFSYKIQPILQKLLIKVK